MSNLPLILALVIAAPAIVWFVAILFEAKEARPPRVREKKRAVLSAPIGRIGEFAEVCTETITNVTGLRQGRLGL